MAWLIVRRLLVILALSPLCLLCACAPSKKEQEQFAQPSPLSTERQLPSTDQQKTEEENNLLIIELKRLYESAQSWQEKRDICIKAIDKGLVYRAGPVSVLDVIFNTKLSSPVAGKEYKVRWSKIYFESKPSGSEQSRKKMQDSEQNSPTWALLVEHDRDVILRYRITTVER